MFKDPIKSLSWAAKERDTSFLNMQGFLVFKDQFQCHLPVWNFHLCNQN